MLRVVSTLTASVASLACPRSGSQLPLDLLTVYGRHFIAERLESLGGRTIVITIVILVG